MGAPIRVEGLKKSYGAVQAVKDASFAVGPGEMFGLIGPDGAGKSTMMRIIVTLLAADAGEVRIGDYDTRKDVKQIRTLAGYMPQRFSLYPDLSIDQNLNFFADLFGVPKKEIKARKERLYQFSRLGEFADRLAGRLSGGMKQKLALSCTLVHEPAFLVLDEPTTGVDPVSRNEFWQLLADLQAQGTTILVSTPYMDEANRCNAVAVMHEGEILAAGKPDSLGKHFSGSLYELVDPDVARTAATIERLDVITAVQGFGDSLHISTESEVQYDSLQSALESALGRSVILKPIKPSLEDVFISLVRRRAA